MEIQNRDREYNKQNSEPRTRDNGTIWKRHENACVKASIEKKKK